MRWPVRLLLGLVLTPLLLVALLLGVALAMRNRPPDAWLTRAAGRYGPELQPALAMLIQGQQDLERVDPLADRPAPGWHGLVQRQVASLDDAEQSDRRRAFRISPRGYEPATEMEVSALRRTADAALAAGIAPGSYAALAHLAQQERLTQGYSIPGVIVRGAQPNFRAAITGHLVTNVKLASQRSALRNAPRLETAPLDPVYPLAVSACYGADGLGVALAQVSQETGWSVRQRIQVAYALGCLFWWSADPAPEPLFAMLAEEASGDPLLRLAAMSGTVQGLNNFLMADDPYAREDIIAFCGQWADALESPWVDAAATRWAQQQRDNESEILLGRCPAYQGYIERVVDWVRSPEPGEQFIADAFFSQPGYVGFLAHQRPDDFRVIAAAAPYENPAFNRLLFLSYTDEVLRQRTLAADTWESMIRTGLAMPVVESAAMTRALGARSAGDWRTIWPMLDAHIRRLPTLPDTADWPEIWPLSTARTLPICPPAANRESDDPEFLASIDRSLAAAWPEAPAGLRQAIADWHLPRMAAAGLSLRQWHGFIPELDNWLLRSADQVTAGEVRAAFAAELVP